MAKHPGKGLCEQLEEAQGEQEVEEYPQTLQWKTTQQGKGWSRRGESCLAVFEDGAEG